MKLLLLLILTFVSYIRATQVYTQFTISGQGIECPTGNELKVDTCTQACGINQLYIKPKYNFSNGTYTASVWKYQSCINDGNYLDNLQFECDAQGDGGSIKYGDNTFSIKCSALVTLAKFDKFKIIDESCKENTEYPIDTCTSYCGATDYFVKFFAVPENVNGYSMIDGDTMELCNAAPTQSDRFNDFLCNNGEETSSSLNGDFICIPAKESNNSTNSSSSTSDSEDGSSTGQSSTIVFSMILLISTILLNIIF